MHFNISTYHFAQRPIPYYHFFFFLRKIRDLEYKYLIKKNFVLKASSFIGYLWIFKYKRNIKSQ